MLVMEKTARYYQEAQTVPLQSFLIEPNIIKRHPNSSHEARDAVYFFTSKSIQIRNTGVAKIVKRSEASRKGWVALEQK